MELSFIDVAQAVVVGNFFTALLGYSLFRLAYPQSDSRLPFAFAVFVLGGLAIGTAISHEGLPRSVTNSMPPAWSETPEETEARRNRVPIPGPFDIIER